MCSGDKRVAEPGHGATISRRRVFRLDRRSLLLSLLVLVSSFWLWQQLRTGPLPSIVQDFAERNGLEGGVIAFGRPGGTPEISAFGTVDHATARALRPDDRFKIASLSKPVTATAILALVRSGAFALDTPVADLLPAFESAVGKRSAAITIRHLLQHSAGWDFRQSIDPFFLDDEALKGLLGDEERPLENCNPLADAMLKRPLQFQPGSRHAYANLGYCWLERVLTTIAKKPYAEAVTDLVPDLQGFSLDPATLTVPPHIADHEADFLVNNPAVLGAAGGWITDIENYFAFASRPIDPVMLERPAYADGEAYYGLGWRVWDLPDGPLVSHFGAMPGVFSIVIRKLDGHLLVAFFKGRPDDPHRAFDEFFRRIIDHHTWHG